MTGLHEGEMLAGLPVRRAARVGLRQAAVMVICDGGGALRLPEKLRRGCQVHDPTGARARSSRHHRNARQAGALPAMYEPQTLPLPCIAISS